MNDHGDIKGKELTDIGDLLGDERIDTEDIKEEKDDSDIEDETKVVIVGNDVKDENVDVES
jgi:hypothetical protein